MTCNYSANYGSGILFLNGGDQSNGIFYIADKGPKLTAGAGPPGGLAKPALG
jgi:hypothetical protein